MDPGTPGPRACRGPRLYFGWQLSTFEGWGVAALQNPRLILGGSAAQTPQRRIRKLIRSATGMVRYGRRSQTVVLRRVERDLHSGLSPQRSITVSLSVQPSYRVYPGAVSTGKWIRQKWRRCQAAICATLCSRKLRHQKIAARDDRAVVGAVIVGAAIARPTQLGCAARYLEFGSRSVHRR